MNYKQKKYRNIYIYIALFYTTKKEKREMQKRKRGEIVKKGNGEKKKRAPPEKAQ